MKRSAVYTANRTGHIFLGCVVAEVHGGFGGRGVLVLGCGRRRRQTASCEEAKPQVTMTVLPVCDACVCGSKDLRVCIYLIRIRGCGVQRLCVVVVVVVFLVCRLCRNLKPPPSLPAS